MGDASHLEGDLDLVNLTGKVAIVTGGTKGIGRGIAAALVAEGVNVCISARKRSEIDETVGSLAGAGPSGVRISEGGRITGLVCDVREHTQVKALFERTISEFGGLDILINNAGIGIFSSVEEMSPEDFRSVLETNLFGVYHCCHEAIPLMKQRGGGYYHQHLFTSRYECPSENGCLQCF